MGEGKWGVWAPVPEPRLPLAPVHFIHSISCDRKSTGLLLEPYLISNHHHGGKSSVCLDSAKPESPSGMYYHDICGRLGGECLPIHLFAPHMILT